MMLDMKACLTALAITSAASATVLWDGRFNDYRSALTSTHFSDNLFDVLSSLCFSTATDFNKWSWSSQVGTYQTYIYVSIIHV